MATRTTIATLMEEIALLRAEIAAKPAGVVQARTFRTKAERAAGKGYACTATPPCSRSDLRTTKNAGSHVLPHGHTSR